MDWLLATKEAHAFHQVLEARGSPALAGPERATAVPNSALERIHLVSFFSQLSRKENV
jgi:hypothetical protein